MLWRAASLTRGRRPEVFDTGQRQRNFIGNRNRQCRESVARFTADCITEYGRP